MTDALPAGACHVWWTDPAAVPADLVALLDADERTRLGRFHHEADRRRFRAAHALVRVVLARYVGGAPGALRFVHRCGACGGPHGKPALVGADLEFSLSHAGERVAVAVCLAPTGLDVEARTRDLDPLALAGIALAPAERLVLEALHAADRSAALLRYWTRKEAVLKATGQGLSTAPGDLIVSGPDAEPRLLGWAGAGAAPPSVRLYGLDLGPGYEACVAVLSEVAHRVDVQDAAGLFGAGPS